MTAELMRPGDSDRVNAESIAFALELEQDLARGVVDVPSFPHIATRVRKVLSDDDVSADKVVRVIGSEPALAARVLQLANSAALNTTRRRVADLRTAIARVGFIMVRGAAIAFAIVQLRKAAALKGLERQLDELWMKSTTVAALSHAVARRLTRVNPDVALLGGLLHGIGRLYILTRAHRYPGVLADRAAYVAVERDWQDRLTRALLISWESPREIVEAVRAVETGDCDDDLPPELSLADVLAVATLLAEHRSSPGLLDPVLLDVPAFRRLQLDPERCRALLGESDTEVTDLIRMLGT